MKRLISFVILSLTLLVTILPAYNPTLYIKVSQIIPASHATSG